MQSVDYIYWTFSSAAQSVSAFAALLLTGYAIVHNLMDSVRERDDTLEEIQNQWGQRRIVLIFERILRPGLLRSVA